MLTKFINWLLDPRTAELWHPDSPGMKVTVTRTRIGRFFKPTSFATLSECPKSGITWRKYDPVHNCQVYLKSGCAHVDGVCCDINTCVILNDHIKMMENSCPVCGYYCIGKGGFGCIHKNRNYAASGCSFDK